MRHGYLLLVAAASACSPNTTTLTEQERATIATAVDSATRAFEAAQRERDADRIIAHLAPDFFMRVDGTRMVHDSVAAGIRRGMSELAALEPGFSDVAVGVLGPSSAFASFVFRDSAVTTAGEVRVTAGATTLIWERRNDGWRIIFADADHRPAGGP